MRSDVLTTHISDLSSPIFPSAIDENADCASFPPCLEVSNSSANQTLAEPESDFCWRPLVGVGLRGDGLEAAGPRAVSALPPAEERDAVRAELLPRDAVEEEVDGTARKGKPLVPRLSVRGNKCHHFLFQ